MAAVRTRAATSGTNIPTPADSHQKSQQTQHQPDSRPRPAHAATPSMTLDTAVIPCGGPGTRLQPVARP